MNADFESRISGKEFALAENDYEIHSVYFAFCQGELTFAWTDENTLEITGRFVEESLRTQTIVCTFSERFGSLSVTIEPRAAAIPSRFPMMGQTVVLRGTLIEIR